MLRDHLRRATRDAHDAVDDAFSAFELADAGGRAAFLRAHESALRRFRPARPGGRGGRLRTRMARAVSADLRALGVPSMGNACRRVTLHPLAVDYVLGGSLLGMAVLRRGLPPQRAGALLSLPPDPAGWRATLDALARLPADGAAAAPVLRDALRLFFLYEACARDAAALTRSDGDAHLTPAG